VKGFYVCWGNDPPNTKIKDWNVTELKVGLVDHLLSPSPSFKPARAPPQAQTNTVLPQIDPNRRHVDKSTIAQFWMILDAWMVANKPWMVVT
jgi:parafibromin